MKEFLDYTLIEYDNFNFKVYTLLEIIVVFFIVKLLLYIIKTGITKSTRFDVAKKYSVYQLIKYVAYVITAIAFFHIVGFNVSYLLLGSSALLVGLGFGLQNLFSDFISGIILLIDSSVKVDDVIEVDGLVGKVVQIDFRTTMVVTRDDKYIIVPNTDLTKNQLVNWTHNDILSRFEIKVGVSYNSDVNVVIKLLKEATLSHKDVEKNQNPSSVLAILANLLSTSPSCFGPMKFLESKTSKVIFALRYLTFLMKILLKFHSHSALFIHQNKSVCY